MTKTPEQLLNDLAEHGGAIVSTDVCSPLEIAAARASGDMAVREDGVGFVRRQKLYVERADELLLKHADDELRKKHEIEQLRENLHGLESERKLVEERIESVERVIKYIKGRIKNRDEKFRWFSALSCENIMDAEMEKMITSIRYGNYLGNRLFNIHYILSRIEYDLSVFTRMDLSNLNKRIEDIKDRIEKENKS